MRAVLALVLLAACGDNSVGTPDAAPAPDANPPFTCATDTCDPATQYCYIIEAGATSPGCQPLPAQCSSCDCVTAAFPQGDCAGGLFCSADGDRITLACMLP